MNNQIKQKIIKISEDVANDFTYYTNKTHDSKSVVVQSKMREFIKAVDKGLYSKNHDKKPVGIVVPEELFEEFKIKCKEINYKVGEALDILLTNYNESVDKKLKK